MSSRNPAIIYGTAWKEDQTAALVERAVAAGFRAIDTANQPKHYNEPHVGHALQRLYSKGVTRDELFLQTKFTPRGGQDHRLPYDPSAPIADQVRQSFAGSLKNLQTDYLDSLLLHGPYSRDGLTDSDWEVWGVFETLYNEGTVRAIGISNVSAPQLAELCRRARIPPMIVQNRCYAVREWDRKVRDICRENRVTYQGFSLLTGNPDVVHHRTLKAVAAEVGLSPAQLIYRYAIEIGIVPLTGTTNPTHMREALAVQTVALDAGHIERIGGLQ